jgi:flagellar FliJ protein
MKSIETLIKVSKQDLDEKRRELVELEGQKQKLEGWASSMASDLKREQEFAAANPEMSMTFDAYRKKINDHQRNIRIAMIDLNAQIGIMADKIAILFGEVKKYEILHQQKLLVIVKEQKAKESKALDEIAINNYLKENL